MRSEKLQDKYAYAPRAMRADNAAAYLGMGKTKFLELVDKGVIPRAIDIDGIRIWDRFDLDAVLEAAKENATSDRNSFDKILAR
jgi:predicted DNA-binding transcriptional regulator AlpA